MLLELQTIFHGRQTPCSARHWATITLLYRRENIQQRNRDNDIDCCYVYAQ